ncbi:hypothetical protein GKZ28_18425 [Clostridium chromiireducens]|uniref:Inhibitor of apoptosis-promoting Bax1 n=1 Tax=Clostridium chromiireducens TaxID=225345 RepID=A0A964RQ46_9CLOT|nr:Bax inhibitor-1 family protein [Clostridium chromiireducens]MVX65660.1 hypothetical protein [Clostridium chromiireducens]
MLEEDIYRQLRIKRETAMYYKKYVSYLMLSLVLTTIGAYIGNYIMPLLTEMEFYFGCGAILLVLTFVSAFSFGIVKKYAFYIYAFGQGITITPILSLFTTVSVYKCLIATALIVSSFCIIGLKLKDLSFLENILLTLIIILSGLTVLDIFVHLPYVEYFALGAFYLHVMYDINSFKSNINKRLDFIDDEFVLDSVMHIYLHILILFKYLLATSSDDD